MSDKLSRRSFLKWAGAGATGALLAACAPKEVIVNRDVEVTREVEVEVEVEKTVEVEKQVAVEVTAPPEPIEINVWWGNWGEFFNELMTTIGTSYMEEYPGSTVEWTFNPEWKQSLLTAIAAGTPPDAIYTDVATTISLAADDAILPLDAYLVMTGLEREDFVTAMYDSGVQNGKLYGLPGGADYLALFWNKDVYAEAGLDPESPPVTADELVEHSLKLLEVDDTGAIQRLGWTPNTWSNPLWMWAYIFGGEWYDDSQNKITASHPKNVETLEWMKSYTDQVDINQLAAFNESLPDFWSPGNSFASKRNALRFDGFWTYDPLDAYAPDIDYGVAFYPTLNGTPAERANYGVAGWLVAIPAGAPNPDAAWHFLNYGFVENAAKMGCDTLNGNSIIDQMPEFEQCVTEGLGPDNRMTPYFNVFSETGLAATRFFPAIPVNALYGDELDRAYDFVVRGEMSAQEALEEVEDTVQSELNKLI